MDKKRIAPGFLQNNIYRFIHMALSQLGGIIFTIIIARVLGPEDFGVYVLALSFALVLIALGELGINEATIRYISLNQKNLKKAKSYFMYLLKIKILSSFILSLILILLSKFLAYFYNEPKLFFPALIAGGYIFFYSLIQMIPAIFVGFEDVKFITYKELVFQLSRLLLIPIIFVLSPVFIIASPIFLAIIASIIGLIFSIICIKKNYPEFFKSKASKFDKKELFSFMKYLSIGSLSILFLLYADILILGKFVELEFLGFYKAATSIILMASSFLTLTMVLYPILTKLNKKKIRKIFDVLLYYSFMISIPLTIGVIFMGNALIRVLFGQDYLLAAIPLYGLALLIFILPLEEMFRTLINSKGESKLTAKIMMIASILNILLNFIFIYVFLLMFKQPIYAALGVGIATTLSRSFVLINLVITSKRKFNITITPKYIIKPLIASFGMVLFLIYFNSLIGETGSISLMIIELILAVLIYFILLFLIKGVSKQEFNYILGLFKENLKKNSEKTN